MSSILNSLCQPTPIGVTLGLFLASVGITMVLSATAAKSMNQRINTVNEDTCAALHRHNALSK